jgi:ATP-dependent DNA ligase
VDELPAARGADHDSIHRLVQRFTSLFADAARPCRHASGDRPVAYLYRAVDRYGQVIVMPGKTVKGLTDAMLAWQTERLGALAVADDGWAVGVRPELVVEVAVDGVQTSPRHPGGVALRFARVLRYREDKTAAEADTTATVRAIHAGDRETAKARPDQP